MAFNGITSMAQSFNLTNVNTNVTGSDLKNQKNIEKFSMDKFLSKDETKAPYSHLAHNGIIEYKGVIFNCDDEKGLLCLGDVSNEEKCLTIPLSKGGSLVVNRDNLGQLTSAISMFSPEDIKRIMCAIADDKKAQEVQNTIEEEKNGIGDNRNNVKDEI